MAVVQKTGYSFGFDTKKGKAPLDIKDYISSELGIDVQVIVGHDADGDGKADDVLILVDPSDEDAFEEGVDDLKTFIKHLDSPKDEVVHDELDLTVKKKYDKDGKEK